MIGSDGKTFYEDPAEDKLTAQYGEISERRTSIEHHGGWAVAAAIPSRPGSVLCLHDFMDDFQPALLFPYLPFFVGFLIIAILEEYKDDDDSDDDDDGTPLLAWAKG